MILGIDPGFGGALAWYSPKGECLVALSPMPTVERGSLLHDDRSRIEIDAAALTRAIRATASDLSFAVVEKVSASPQMGVTSAFRFGEGFGIVCGVLEACGVRIRFVYPSAWKAACGLSSDKKQSTARAIELFPEYAEQFKKGRRSADLAEAALLAHYGLRLQLPLKTKK